MTIIQPGETEAKWTQLPEGVPPPVGIYVEFQIFGALHWGATASLSYHTPDGERGETVFVAHGSDIGGGLHSWPKVFMPREVRKWRQTTELRGMVDLAHPSRV